MRHARTLLVGVLSSLLVLGSVDAAASPSPSVPAVPPAPATSAPTSAPTSATGSAADDVVVLHTDSAAGARSGALRDAIERLGATVRHTFGDQRTVSLELPADADPTAQSTTDRLADLPGVAAVEPPVTRSFDALPNDPQLPAQRSYLDAVAAPAAWNRQSGSAAVKIAIVDSGIDTGHPDLAGKIVGRYNATNRSTSVTDTVGHGTFVAGVAAAATNNATGVAGAGYNSSILAVKVADRYGDIAVDDEIAGIRWAADQGAKIINLSLSGPDSSAAELKAVQYAQAKGALVVAAAGNEGTTTRQYPAAYPGVVAVGATDVAKGGRASFSSHGSWVTLAAPGVNLLSTTPRSGSDYFPGKTGYGRGDGTSFSSPLVAGAAALLAAQNPAMTADQLRAALVASAHGYAGNDLGAGQIDFNLALDHATPTSVPTLPLVVGTSGSVTFSAVSTAPRVSFRVDNGPWLPPVAVSGPTATLAFASYGYASSSHTLSAVDCSAYNECNYAGVATSSFLLTNLAPTLTAPAAGATVSGEFPAAATADGGAVRLLVDGQEAGFSAGPSYSFKINGSAFDNGNHDLTVQSCTASHSLCEGPASPVTTVSFDSLHPVITDLTRTEISPNDDGSGDTATLTFALDQAQQVKIETRDAAGTAVRTDDVPTGDSYVWRGVDDAGARLPDGNYTLALVTSQAGSAGTRYGFAARAVVVDTVAPRLLGVVGNGTRFFPFRDGYLDAFTPTASLPDGGLFTFAITSAGRPVRTLQAAVGPIARTGLAWDGRDPAGRQVRAGLYGWTFAVADAAGNVTRSPLYRTYVDSRRLRTKTVSVVRHARAKLRGSAKCATKTRSSFRRGAHLVNRCKGGSGEVSYATYSIKVPKALRYGRMSFAAKGRSASRSQLSASFRRADGGLEVPRSVRVKPSKVRWRTVGSVPVSGHVRHGKINVTLLLTSRYAGTNDFDARSVRLRVTVVRLG